MSTFETAQLVLELRLLAFVRSRHIEVQKHLFLPMPNFLRLCGFFSNASAGLDEK
jgi:hypothetical protein